MVVWMPSTRNSRSARRMTANASARVGWWTSSLATMRVVVRRHAVARRRRACRAARPGPPGGCQRRDRPGTGRKSLAGSSALMRHSMARPALDDVLLREPQLLAGRDADLLADQVDAGDQLRDRVLDLDAGVDLDEVEVVVLVHEELAGAGVVVAGLPWPAGPRRRRCPGGPLSGRFGAGDSSTSFWCRRWSEQSRSKRWTTLPCRSPRSCTSTCRGCSRYFSR